MKTSSKSAAADCTRLALASSLLIHVLGVWLVFRQTPRGPNEVSVGTVVRVEPVEHDPAAPPPTAANRLASASAFSGPTTPPRFAAVHRPRNRRRPLPSRSLTEPGRTEGTSTNPLVEGSQVPNAVTVPPVPPLVDSTALTKDVTFPSGGRSSAPPSDSRQVDLMRWEKIGQAVRRQVVYPTLARRRGMQGRTTIRFIVDSSGTPSDVRIVESSGHAILDEAALDAVARAAPLPAVAVPTQIVVPIIFALH